MRDSQNANALQKHTQRESTLCTTKSQRRIKKQKNIPHLAWGSHHICLEKKHSARASEWEELLQKTKFAFTWGCYFKKQPHSKTCAHAWKMGSGKQSLWSPQRCHSGVTTGESESVKQRDEQLDCIPVVLLRVPPRPTTRDRHYRPGKTQGGREDRKEGWDWPLPLEEECVEAELKRGRG